MIKKIKYIKNLAVFQDFSWNESVRDEGNNICNFEKLNIIYGRNYSGKTMLSRILSSVEENALHAKYPNAEFEIEFDDNPIITQNNLVDNTQIVRVYNKDFVKKNLKCFIEDDGIISPFAIVGGNNITIEDEINKIENILGDEEQKNGKKYELKLLSDNLISKNSEYNNRIDRLNNKLKTKARNIKENTKSFNKVTYNINAIKDDIKTIKKVEKEVFSQEDISTQVLLLKDEVKKELPLFVNDYNAIKGLVNLSEPLVAKKIIPTKPIQELLNNSLLQQWVKNGMEFHRNKLKKCSFCGQYLPFDLWNKLDSHFNKESEELISDIEKIIALIDKEKDRVSKIELMNKEYLYSSYQNEWEDNSKKWKLIVQEYIDEIDILRLQLDAKKNDIFGEKLFTPVLDKSQDIIVAETELSGLIEKNNNKTKTLTTDQNEAREALRLDEIRNFVVDLDYDNEIQEIEKILEEKNDLVNKVGDKTDSVEKLSSKIEELKTEIKDEKKGAEQVNRYLNDFFGHEGLRLVHEDNEDIYRFVIKRGENVAENLSEGECSLISFCYFMAKLEEAETKGKKIIIWIDDPISSLDSNHVFFVFSLIESVIAKQKNYEQLFISTHNLEFLKYLKRLSVPKKSIAVGNGKTKKVPAMNHFFIERNREVSYLMMMPKYLKKYITEFNYLFEQIYKCSLIETANSEYECVYSFGNNLRKFLEAYLFYKYPNNTDIIVKMKKFFKDDTVVALVNRVDNELSHLEEIFDRSMKPIMIPEIPKLASYVLNKIKEKDPEQYHALLISIGEA